MANGAADLGRKIVSRLQRDSSGGLTLQGVPLDALEEKAPRGTPFYVYDLDSMADEVDALRAAFGSEPHLVAYAVKANSAGPVLRALAARGAGADVVSGAELELSVACGIPPGQIVYSGVAKLDRELDLALSIQDEGILAIQAESIEELPRIAARARAVGRRARVSLRLNPDIEADTHSHIATGHDEAKFGIPIEDLVEALHVARELSEVDLVGLGSHIGSQLTTTSLYVEAAKLVVQRWLEVNGDLESRGGRLRLVDFGGGFGIDYGAGCEARPRDFVAALRETSRPLPTDVVRVVEPGRSIVGGHGALVTRVVMQKRTRSRAEERRWVMIDAGMNDLLRPALYGARHRIEVLRSSSSPLSPARVVGPVCESSDDFGTYDLPQALDLLVVRDTGAYGFTMASEYNGRALPCELFLSGGKLVASMTPRSDEAWVASRASVPK
jgi:diaminopimelate decarboxylase